MSFRTRLSVFFVLIAVVPMIALGVVVLRLLSDSEDGKAGARAGAYAAAVLRSYRAAGAESLRVAGTIARDRPLSVAIQRADRRGATRRARQLLRSDRLARVRVRLDARSIADVGTANAIAGGSARVRGSGAVIEAAAVSAARFVRASAAPGLDVVLFRDDAPLAGSLHNLRSARTAAAIPPRGTVTLAGTRYAVASFRASPFPDVGADTVMVLARTRTGSAAAHRRWIALAVLAAFLLLAAAGALLVSRQLQQQIARFLIAAQRIGRGDFSARVPVTGDDEFAALGRQFNDMASELSERVEQLAQERGRLRELVHRIGETFASSLDRAALLEIGTHTAVDAVAACCGRATVRGAAGELLECARVGDLAGAEEPIRGAETRALVERSAVVVTTNGVSALAAPIAHDDRDAFPGLITVARHGAPFDATERELVASLGHQTGVLLENLDLHDQVKRQAVTDELTGLFNHRRFQEVVTTEVAAAHRFGQPLGLLMLDIDDFKRINDTYGHQQGDVVLREVARVLRAESREIDEPARYGGEEMAVALPQTDLDGAYAIAERVRTAVERLQIPRLDGEGALRVTVSCGVASSAEEDKQALIAAADVALYAAKRAGKNRTERAAAQEAEPVSAEEQASS